ncbi:MAG: hypothetical protein IJ809_06670 [Clostridia bacterium]|nr:hypothetical protein [Clostridia bacterium]
MNKLLSLNTNMLKILACIFVIIDHIAVYFYNYMTLDIYVSFRIIGRLAMPVFAYLVVQGFFHTRSINKYVQRLMITGIVTEIIMLTMYTLNKFVFISYQPSFDVTEINIIITFAVSIIILKAIDNVIEKKVRKEKIDKKDILLIAFSCILTASYFFVKFDYSYKLLIYMIMLYAIEKVKQKKNLTKLVYLLLQFVALVVFVIIYNSEFEYFAVFSIFLLAMYNFERGKKSKIITSVFYAFYPIQHLLLFLTAMLCSK